MYTKGFIDTDIKPIKHNLECQSSCHLYQIRVPNRNEVMEYLNANDIFPGVHYKDNTQYELYSKARNTCPNAKKLSEEVISLPLHMFLTEKDIQKVIKIVIKATKR